MLKKERFVIMNILVVGCGKVGSRLASVLSRQGHDVSIVSNNEEEFDLLSSDFNGFTTHGVPIDQEILKKAGIELGKNYPHPMVDLKQSRSSALDLYRTIASARSAMDKNI